MTDRTNDAIYDKVESVGSDVKSLKTYVTEGHPSKTVTTTHFDTKVGELKKAIEGGPKTNPKSFKDSLIEFFGAKSLVDSFKESGLAQLVLATGATVALLSTLGIKLLDTEKAVKALTRGSPAGGNSARTTVAASSSQFRRIRQGPHRGPPPSTTFLRSRSSTPPRRPRSASTPPCAASTPAPGTSCPRGS